MGPRAAGESATAGPAVGPLVPLVLQPLVLAWTGQGRLAEGHCTLCVGRQREVSLEDSNRIVSGITGCLVIKK